MLIGKSICFLRTCVFVRVRERERFNRAKRKQVLLDLVLIFVFFSFSVVPVSSWSVVSFYLHHVWYNRHLAEVFKPNSRVAVHADQCGVTPTSSSSPSSSSSSGGGGLAEAFGPVVYRQSVRYRLDRLRLSSPISRPSSTVVHKKSKLTQRSQSLNGFLPERKKVHLSATSPSDSFHEDQLSSRGAAHLFDRKNSKNNNRSQPRISSFFRRASPAAFQHQQPRAQPYWMMEDETYPSASVSGGSEEQLRCPSMQKGEFYCVPGLMIQTLCFTVPLNYSDEQDK